MRINERAAADSLLGTALGDSLGLPYEGLGPERAQKLMPFPLRQRLIGRTGCLSDDTVQSAIALQALIQNLDSPDKFQRDFGRRLRLWFLTGPPGIGLATIKACSRLTVGVASSKSGVNSAGNGAAMRSAVLGAALSKEPELREHFVTACCRVTHTHPLAIQGAQLIALAAALAAEGQQHKFEAESRKVAIDWPWGEMWTGRGPTGYVVPSVNAALHIWSSNAADLDEAISKAVELGGDTDTVAAMVGGIAGAAGARHYPAHWQRYIGWPQPDEIRLLSSGKLIKTPGIRMAATHLLALPPILTFGLRRIFPPY